MLEPTLEGRLVEASDVPCEDGRGGGDAEGTGTLLIFELGFDVCELEGYDGGIGG